MPYKNKTNKEYQREYYLKNRDGNAEKHRKYYEMNKEKYYIIMKNILKEI